MKSTKFAILRLFAAVIIVIGIDLSAVGQQAVITGHVYDAEGRGVAQVKVKVFPLETGFSDLLPSAQTDGSGAYALTSAPLGKTRIIAIKEESGYPDTMSAIFAPDHAFEPEVRLDPGVQLKGVDIHLPPPDGSIEGQVVDSTNGKLVPYGRVLLERVGEPQVMESTDLLNGHFIFHLPKRPIQIIISARGFQQVRLMDPDTGKPYFDLESYDHKKMTVLLKPLS